MDTRELFLRWQGERDPRAREILVGQYMPLAYRLAARYWRSSEPPEDLVQVAAVGLLEAIDRFDCQRDIAFSSFAVPTILGELKRHFRDHCWSLHVARREQELVLHVQRAREQLAAQRGSSPTVEQVAEFLELNVEKVLTALEVIAADHTASLDAPVTSSDRPAMPLVETVGHVEERYALVEARASLAAAAAKLPLADRRLLALRFAEGLTQAEVAARLGISQMQVSRMLRRVLARWQRLYRGGEAQQQGLTDCRSPARVGRREKPIPRRSEYGR